MSEKKPKVLITGGSGFIGAYTALHLIGRGAQVVLLDQKPPAGRLAYLLRNVPWGYLSLDVTDRAQTLETITEQQPDAIVHGAAIVDPVSLLTNPELAADVNIAGTVNVICAMRIAAIPRLVYLSSISVLPRPITDPITIDHPLLLGHHGPGGGFYGASKIAGEAFCHAAIDGLGLDCSIVRPSAVYGFGMSWGMGVKEMVEGAVQSGDYATGSATTVPRDFTYVRDVASLIGTLALSRGLSRRAFMGASGEKLKTLHDVVSVVRRLVPEARIDLTDNVTDDDIRETSYRGRLEIDSQTAEVGWVPEWSLGRGLDEYIALERQYATSAEALPNTAPMTRREEGKNDVRNRY